MIVVVGEKQGGGGTRRHLARMLDVSVEELLGRVVWVNLWEIDGTDVPGLVKLIQKGTDQSDLIVMLGRRVARALMLDDMKPLEVRAYPVPSRASVVAVPHPSGLNRWYNDPDHAEDAALILKRLWRTWG